MSLSKKNKIDLLNKIVNKIKEEGEYSKLKEKVLKASNEWNKELLFQDFENKVRVFLSYEEEGVDFPVESWVDSFFENE